MIQAAKKIQVKVPRHPYPIFIGRGLLAHVGAAVRKAGAIRVGVVTDQQLVATAFYKKLLHSLKQAGIAAQGIVLPPSEQGKTLKWLAHIYHELVTFHAHRDTWLLSLGGGAIGDVTGFAAATYMRGVSYAHLPTTLLAQTDASIGGKTGINLPEGKNLVGAFHQPQAVWIDLDTLTTLPARERRTGLAEVVKYGVISPLAIRGKSFFTYLEAHQGDLLRFVSCSEVWEELIHASCRVKAAVVARDEREQGIRAQLNFGHTVGHAIEAASCYRRYYHGEAVAMGMVAESSMAVGLGMLSRREQQRLVSLLKALGLPTCLQTRVLAKTLMEKFLLDKKVKQGAVRFVLPTRLGKVIVRKNLPKRVVQQALVDIGCQ